MTVQIPVVDLQLALSDDAPPALLDSVLETAERVGIIQVVNHGVAPELIDDFHDRIGAVLDLPRAEKAKLASPTGHPFRGWRQWPDDFGRLELERFNIGQFDNPEEARAAGLAAEHATLYKHPNVWPEGLRAVARAYHDASVGVAEQVLALYAKVLGVSVATFPVGGCPYYTSLRGGTRGGLRCLTTGRSTGNRAAAGCAASRAAPRSSTVRRRCWCGSPISRSLATPSRSRTCAPTCSRPPRTGPTTST
ncbi:2-oxoglutarate and iron-dependent oxygenase domain-containing protein [Acrocarpospora sp. B8E8]|uniref:2-oxoglutarate and iron-dependent oxygenase domain-containing protein n=1 Tax=Acrocarpospora sp. B8E8 TaxID=3153572 RepID=UPI00325D7FED